MAAFFRVSDGAVGTHLSLLRMAPHFSPATQKQPSQQHAVRRLAHCMDLTDAMREGRVRNNTRRQELTARYTA